MRSHRRNGLVVLTVAATVLAACSSPPSSGANAGRSGVKTSKLPACPVAALKSATGPVSVDLWFGGLAGAPTGVIQAMAKDFNKSQNKVVVHANNQGTSYEEVLSKYVGASGTPKQLPQIIYLEDNTLGEMVDKGQVLPAQSCMEADHYDVTNISAAARAHYSVDNVLYPGYMNVSTPVIYYNKAAFVKAGLDPNKPPTTLEEIRTDAEALKAKGVSSHPLSFKEDPWFLENWLSGVGEDAVNNGNGRIKAPTKATFNTPAAVKLLTFFQKMNKDGLLAPFPYLAGSISHYLALLPQGKQPAESSMLLETSTASSTIAAFLGGTLTAAEIGSFGSQGKSVDTSGLVPGAGEFPGISKPGQIFASGGAFYILNTSSPAQEAASWAFLKWMLQPENALKWHTGAGYLPVVKGIRANPALASQLDAFDKNTVAGQMESSAVKQLDAALPQQAGPLMGPYPQYLKAIEAAENDVMTNGTDPAKALAAAQASVNATLKEYNGN